MVTLYLCGRMLWRERHPLNAIGFAALVMLAVNPSALLDAGFQMTLLSVLAVTFILIVELLHILAQLISSDNEVNSRSWLSVTS